MADDKPTSGDARTVLPGQPVTYHGGIMLGAPIPSQPDPSQIVGVFDPRAPSAPEPPPIPPAGFYWAKTSGDRETWTPVEVTEHRGKRRVGCIDWDGGCDVTEWGPALAPPDAAESGATLAVSSTPPVSADLLPLAPALRTWLDARARRLATGERLAALNIRSDYKRPDDTPEVLAYHDAQRALDRAADELYEVACQPLAAAPTLPIDAHPLLHSLARTVEDIDREIARLAAKRAAARAELIAKLGPSR